MRVRIGEPIAVGDLLQEYSERRIEARKAEGISDDWTTTSVDEELYSKITAVRNMRAGTRDSALPTCGGRRRIQRCEHGSRPKH